MFSQLQFYVLWVLSVVVFAIQVIALIDAIRRPARAFAAEHRLSKNIWLLLLGVAAAIGFISIPTGIGGGLGFFGIIAVVPAAIYWYDVRPKLQPYGRGRSQGPSGW